MALLDSSPIILREETSGELTNIHGPMLRYAKGPGPRRFGSRNHNGSVPMNIR